MSIINCICATVVNVILYLLYRYFYFLCNVCVCFFFLFFTRWPACWAYACSGSLPLDLYIFNCIVLLFMLWQIKFSLSLTVYN